MSLKNFELGILRTFYVAWGLLAIFAVAVMVSVLWNTPVSFFSDPFKDESLFWEIAVVPLLPLAAALVPWLGMYLVRWVYRGYVPR